MGRPKTPRRVCSKPCCSCFTPQSGGVLSDGVIIMKDEFEALKLHDIDGFNQSVAAKKMNVSQPTFARILASAHKKLSSAIIKGGEIRIN